MKLKRIFLSVLMIFFMAVTSTQANPMNDDHRMLVKIDKYSHQSIKIQLANLEKVRTGISITDLDGKVWFSEYVWGESGYAKELNLKGMLNGFYILEVKNKMGTYIQAFTKKEESILFYKDKNEANTSIAQLTSNKKDRLFASVKMYDQESMAVRIANLDKHDAIIRFNYVGGVPLFSEKTQQQYAYAKKINLKGLANGIYYVYVDTEQLHMIQWIKIGKDGITLGDRQILDESMTNVSVVLR